MGMYRHKALSLSALKKWRKRFVTGRITLEDDSWSEKPPRSDLCESIQALIDNTPFISRKRMRQKLWIPMTICLWVLYEDIGFRKCYLKWVPHSITENEGQGRVIFSKKVLQVVRHAKETNFEHLLAGDESWLEYQYPPDSA
jgi:hypothetical protein